jgi:hypothetical protein
LAVLVLVLLHLFASVFRAGVFLCWGKVLLGWSGVAQWKSGSSVQVDDDHSSSCSTTRQTSAPARKKSQHVLWPVFFLSLSHVQGVSRGVCMLAVLTKDRFSRKLHRCATYHLPRHPLSSSPVEECVSDTTQTKGALSALFLPPSFSFSHPFPPFSLQPHLTSSPLSSSRSTTSLLSLYLSPLS